MKAKCVCGETKEALVHAPQYHGPRQHRFEPVERPRKRQHLRADDLRERVRGYAMDVRK